MTGTRDREAGFLLADMLATLTISALVLVALAGLGPLMLRTTDRSVAAIDAADALGRTLLSLDRLVRSASRTRMDGTASRPFLFNGDGHRIMLAYQVQDPGALPVTRAVAFRVDPEGHLLRAEAVLPARLTALGDLPFGPPRLVYAGGARLRFAFEDRAPAGKTAGPAAPLWPVGDRMPAAVTIDALDAVTGRILASVRSVIAADADLGCVDGTVCGRDDLPGRLPTSASGSGATP